MGRAARFDAEAREKFLEELRRMIQEYSDALLVHLLKAHRPEKYRERHAINLNTNPQPFGEDQERVDALLERLSDEEKAILARIGREDAKRGPLQ